MVHHEKKELEVFFSSATKTSLNPFTDRLSLSVMFYYTPYCLKKKKVLYGIFSDWSLEDLIVLSHILLFI